jgi:hypothetical protein
MSSNNDPTKLRDFLLLLRANSQRKTSFFAHLAQDPNFPSKFDSYLELDGRETHSSTYYSPSSEGKSLYEVFEISSATEQRYILSSLTVDEVLELKRIAATMKTATAEQEKQELLETIRKLKAENEELKKQLSEK